MKKSLLAILTLAAIMIALCPLNAMAAEHKPIYYGFAKTDYLAEQILQQILTAGKSDREKIQAVYDWVITHFHRYESEWDGTEYYDDAKVEAALTDEYVNAKRALVNKGDILLRGDFYYDYYYGEDYDYKYPSEGFAVSFYADSINEILKTRTTDCVGFALTMNLLLNHLGYDCQMFAGYFINNDGSEVEHKWNYVLVGDKYYWL